MSFPRFCSLRMPVFAASRWLGVTLLLALWWFPCPGLQAAAVSSLRIQLPPEAGPVVQNVARIFSGQITRRCTAVVRTSGEAPLVVELAIVPGVGEEGYRILDGPAGAIRIEGNDERGLLYGVGKFLHTSRYDQGRFTPSTWRGTSAPQCPFRTIYLATHFMNFYEAAPAEEVEQYLEEVALWGANGLMVGFPTWQFQGFDDPAAKKNLAQLHRLLRAGRAAGLRVVLGICPNQAFASAPKATLNKPYPDDLGRRGDLGVNCCPSSPEGHAYLIELYRHLFEEFQDPGVDCVVFWPYDEGGCGCATCWPWGAAGFPRISRDVAQLARQRFPHLKVVLSTWVYDTPPADEWQGLAQFLHDQPGWADYILADAHEDFPRYPLDVGVPGGLPLVNFPEISMWGRNPWGAYGINPLPDRLERLWKQTQGKLSGGMPYSEGIYEDLNKVLCLQLYWDKQRSPDDTLREYLAYEYSPDVVPELLQLVHLLEETWPKRGPKTEQAYQMACAIEAKLPPQTKTSWRWRLLYLRTLIDRELEARRGKNEGPVLQAAYDELRRIYHAEQAHPNVRPPMGKKVE